MSTLQDLRNNGERWLDSQVGRLSEGASGAVTAATNIPMFWSGDLVLDTTEFTRGGVTVDNDQIVVTMPGLYLVRARVTVASGTGSRGVRIDINNVFQAPMFVAALGIETGAQMTKIFNLNSGDRVSMQAYQDQAASLALVTGSTRNYLQVTRVG